MYVQYTTHRTHSRFSGSCAMRVMLGSAATTKCCSEVCGQREEYTAHLHVKQKF